MKTKTQATHRIQIPSYSVRAPLLIAFGLLMAIAPVPAEDQDEQQSSTSNPPLHLAALRSAAHVTRDTLGIAHINARNAHDLFFVQGYVHAQDRLFQMDMNRRLGSGTLAELLGEGALPTDVQLRTIGLRRAAERSFAALSPRARTAVEAYAAGVNAFASSNPLPIEYGALELTQFQPWTPVDTVTVAKLVAFDRSFDIDIAPTITLLTYQQTGQGLGFDGAALYFEDLFRSAPFDPAGTVVDALNPNPGPHAGHRGGKKLAEQAAGLHPAALALCQQYFDEIKDLPVFKRLISRDKHAGSNEWGVSGALTATGNAMLANDTHLSLGIPGLFYPMHLQAGEINAAGSSVAGVPFIILGQNRRISWGATVNYIDVTDTFQEQVVPDAASPSGLSIVHNGQNEPIIPIPEVFRKNNFDGVPDNITVVPPSSDIPPVTLIVPRRNNGPIVKLDLANGIALSVQYTGFSPTRELESFMLWNEAKGLDDFIEGLQFFDVGSLNWAYSDVHGNIAYFSGSELPIREDLQAGTVNGLPPYFIRNGAGGNDWLPVQHPQLGQAVAYEILPFEEMPHIINPPAGWFVNANNDPLGITFDNNPLNQLRPGGGILYLNKDYETFRAGRITQLIKQKLSTGKGKISFEDMRKIQSDTVLIDAHVFVPYIARAFANAQSSTQPALASFAANTTVAAAVQRLSVWDFTAPTGIHEGYDASDVRGVLSPPSSAEIASSVAATIYNIWRGQFIRNTIDAPLTPFGLPVPDDQHSVSALRNLLDHFSTNNGVGASGLNFFNVPGVSSAADRRDVLILKSLSDALSLLAGDSFAAAFAHSANLDDYRWGKLHRLVLEHPLGGPFNVPPAGGLWPAPLPGLDGIPVDGGFSTVDVGNPIGGVRGDNVDAFMFNHGPAHRLISEATPDGMRAELSVPGGVSGAFGSPYYVNLLPGWLSNDSFPLLMRHEEVKRHAASVMKFVPAD